jgi:hypothetical protein
MALICTFIMKSERGRANFIEKLASLSIVGPAQHGKSCLTFNNRAGFGKITPLFQIIVPDFNLLRRILNNCSSFLINKPLLK